MKLIALKSRVITADSDLVMEMVEAVKKVGVTPQEGDIFVITSKVVSVVEQQTRHVKQSAIPAIIRAESDHYLGGTGYPLTIKDGILIPRAGIDESNTAPGTIILWPRQPWHSAERLRTALAKKWGLKKIGVIITDSACRPLRLGVTSIAMSWAGFAGITDERGKRDLYGRTMTVTQRAIADDLAGAASVLTGETNECIPFVLVRDAPVTFTKKTKRPRKFQPRDDLFAPIYLPKLRKLKI